MSLSRFCFGAGEGGERLSELCVDADFSLSVGVVVDEDFFEEGLVDELLDVLGRARVGVADVFGEVEGQFQVGFDLVEVRGAGERFAVYGRQELRETLLLTRKEVEGDGSGVVGFEELLLLPFEFVLLQLQRALFGFDVGAGVAEAFADHVLDAGAEGGGEGDALVVLRDAFFDFGDEDGFHLAGGAAGVASGAHEVGVAGTGFGFAHVDDEAFPAGAAVDGGAKVVGVPTGAFTLYVRGEDVLAALPGVGVDEGLVSSGVEGALEFDDAGVVRVGQDPEEVSLGDGFGGDPWGFDGGEAERGEVGGESEDGPFSGGVLKRPGFRGGSVIWNRLGSEPVLQRS